MKWGRRKPSPSSPAQASSMSHVFPMSWLSKFKQKSNNSEQKVKPNLSSQSRPTPASWKPNLSSQSRPTPASWKPNLASQSRPTPASLKDGRFYGGDDESYWRLSFGEERVEGEKNAGGLKSVRYDSDDELEFLFSSCQKCRPVGTKAAGREEIWKFNDMVSGRRKLIEPPQSVEVSPETVTCNRGGKEREGTEFKVPRRKAVKDQKLRKTSRRVLEEKQTESARQSDKAEEMATVPEEKDIFELEPRKHCYVSSVNLRNSNLKTIEEDSAFEALNLEETDMLSKEKLSSEWQKLKNMKLKELMSKSEKQRKSVYISREPQRRTKQSGKIRVYSPRTAARIECKIKALEDMKKAKMKMKKKMKAVEEITTFDSFAMVKSSFDPQQDFRNSMIEMITEKGIRRPEELEELLACYLTLNADEYHDLIIKVFRQVWFELNQEYFGPELQNEHS